MSTTAIIHGLASLSFEARVIADRLHQSISSNDSRELQSKVVELESTIALLKLAHADGQPSELSDADSSDFQKRFSDALKPCGNIILETVYGPSYFKGLSSSIRKPAAKAVAAEFDRRGLDVPAFLNDY